jgi:putative membrane protein
VRGIWLFIKFLLILAVAMVGAFFALENSQSLGVNFIFINGPTMSAGVWLRVFFASGAFLGMLASSVMVLSYRRKLTKVSK